MNAWLWLWHHAWLFALVLLVLAIRIYVPLLWAKDKRLLLGMLAIALVAQEIFDYGVHTEEKQTARAVAQVVAVKREVKQQAITAQVVDHYITRIQVVHDKGATIIKQVPVYVPIDACPLPGGFRLLHDAAATGVPVPDTARVADAAPVAAQDAAATVAENYATAQQNAEELKALQEWVQAQASAAR